MMNYTINARPTTYKGVNMRSRLEARFAARMDRAGWRWVYEPRVFADETGQYLPDFVATFDDATYYIEVKPTQEMALAAVNGPMRRILASDPAALLFAVWECLDTDGFLLGWFHERGASRRPCQPVAPLLAARGFVERDGWWWHADHPPIQLIHPTDYLMAFHSAPGSRWPGPQPLHEMPPQGVAMMADVQEGTNWIHVHTKDGHLLTGDTMGGSPQLTDWADVARYEHIYDVVH